MEQYYFDPQKEVFLPLICPECNGKDIKIWFELGDWHAKCLKCLWKGSEKYLKRSSYQTVQIGQTDSTD